MRSLLILVYSWNRLVVANSNFEWVCLIRDLKFEIPPGDLNKTLLSSLESDILVAADTNNDQLDQWYCPEYPLASTSV